MTSLQSSTSLDISSTCNSSSISSSGSRSFGISKASRYPRMKPNSKYWRKLTPILSSKRRSFFTQTRVLSSPQQSKSYAILTRAECLVHQRIIEQLLSRRSGQCSKHSSTRSTRSSNRKCCFETCESARLNGLALIQSAHCASRLTTARHRWRSEIDSQSLIRSNSRKIER